MTPCQKCKAELDSCKTERALLRERRDNLAAALLEALALIERHQDTHPGARAAAVARLRDVLHNQG